MLYGLVKSNGLESLFAIEKGFQTAMHGGKRFVFRCFASMAIYLWGSGLGWSWNVFQKLPDGILPRSLFDGAAVLLQNPVCDQLEGERVRRAVCQEFVVATNRYNHKPWFFNRLRRASTQQLRKVKHLPRMLLPKSCLSECYQLPQAGEPLTPMRCCRFY